MSTGQVSAGYALGQISTAKTPRIGLNRVKKARRKEMKLTLKQRFRNWLLDDNSYNEVASQDIYVEEDKLQSDGMRLQIYKASGGYVVETRGYDRKTDRHQNTIHVITEQEDIGDRLSKIIMMESMR